MPFAITDLHVACRLLAALLWLAALSVPSIAAVVTGVQSAAAAEGAPDQVGAYCAIPAPGETPSCQAPARAQYADFYSAVEAGRIDPVQSAAVEEALRAGRDDDSAYLALSSLSYGYYRLAHAAHERGHADARIATRLAGWNALLASVYGAEDTSPGVREAVRLAASDLHSRTPAVGITCTTDLEGDGDECEAAEGLMAALSAIDKGTSLRSPLSRIIERLLGRPHPSLRPSPHQSPHQSKEFPAP